MTTIISTPMALRFDAPKRSSASSGFRGPKGSNRFDHDAVKTGRSTHMIELRRTDRDNRPPSSVVTAVICGDPAPGRSAQDRRNAALSLDSNIN